MLRFRRSADSGFTLVELMVAMFIFGLASAATAPLMLKSIDATQTGKLNTQAKNLLQLRVETMRNLPFHVATSAGPYIDLLDTYFRDANGTQPNTACATRSYASGTYTCKRSGTGATGLALPGFSETVQSRFVDQDNAVVVPLPTYDSQSATGDVPPSQTLSVVITETWSRNGVSRSFSSTTQISSAATGLPQIVARFRDSPLSIDTAVDDAQVPTTLQLDLGLLNATAGLSTGATASAQAQGALAVLSSGVSSTSQATGYLDAPGDQPTFTTVNGVASNGAVCSALVACFGQTRVAQVTGSASNGVPQVGSSSAPLVSSVVRSGTQNARGFWVGNVPTGSTQSGLVRLGVQSASSPPTSTNPTQLLRSVETGAAGSAASCTAAGTADSNAGFATATGFISTTAGPTHAVTSCATATTRRVDLFPLPGATGFNANGIVQIELQYAGVNCAATAGATGTATAVFRGTVSYLPWGSSTPTVLTVASGQATDPLTPALLTKSTTTGGVQVGLDPGGNPLWLGDYVRSWSSGSLARSQVVQSAQVDLKAITVSTVATRDGDSKGLSSINLVAGQLACSAQDNR